MDTITFLYTYVKQNASFFDGIVYYSRWYCFKIDSSVKVSIELATLHKYCVDTISLAAVFQKLHFLAAEERLQISLQGLFQSIVRGYNRNGDLVMCRCFIDARMS